jgi:hypothetical protein
MFINIPLGIEIEWLWSLGCQKKKTMAVWPHGFDDHFTIP